MNRLKVLQINGGKTCKDRFKFLVLLLLIANITNGQKKIRIRSFYLPLFLTSDNEALDWIRLAISHRDMRSPCLQHSSTIQSAMITKIFAVSRRKMCLVWPLNSSSLSHMWKIIHIFYYFTSFQSKVHWNNCCLYFGTGWKPVCKCSKISDLPFYLGSFVNYLRVKIAKFSRSDKCFCSNASFTQCFCAGILIQ